MIEKFKNTIVSAIAESQDGKMLTDPSDWSTFIMARIDVNTEDNGYRFPVVNTDNLISDFRYMIDQLTKAMNAVKKISEEAAIEKY